VIIDKWIDEEGQIVYGDLKRGEEAQKARARIKEATVDFELLQKARARIKEATVDFELLDKEVGKIIWNFTNLFPGCLMKSVDGVRQKKKFFWDQTKLANRHWLAANMQGEAYLGFHAFNTRIITGQDTIDFIKYRQLLAEGHPMDEELFEAVLGQPQG